MFSCKICRFSRNTFFTKQLQRLLLSLNRIFKGVQNKNLYHIQLQKRICCRKNSEAATVGVKRRPVTLLLERASTIAKFLRTTIMKNICERLLLKISMSVTNLEAVVQKCSVKKVFLEILQNS